MKTGIYLAKKGKIYGPIAELEYKNMRESGQIDQFSWIWDLSAQQWKAIDPAPLPLHLQTPVQEARPEEVLASASKPKLERGHRKTYQAICHNYLYAVSGLLNEITDDGCQIQSQDKSPSPVLGQNSSVFINLLDEDSGQTVNVQAQLCDAFQGEGGWTYRIRWIDLPTLPS